MPTTQLYIVLHTFQLLLGYMWRVGDKEKCVIEMVQLVFLFDDHSLNQISIKKVLQEDQKLQMVVTYTNTVV